MKYKFVKLTASCGVTEGTKKIQQKWNMDVQVIFIELIEDIYSWLVKHFSGTAY